jgi:hypothetical protein
MAKLTAGITGWGRGAVAGVQMQTMRGKTFIRAKQPPLGPGNANQTAYRQKFSFIQSQMKLNTQFQSFGTGYLSSVELAERNAVLRQNLADWPMRISADRSICGDNYLWERVHGRFNLFNATDGNLVLDAFNAPPENTIYNVSFTTKHTDGTFKIIVVQTYSSGTRIVEIEDQFIDNGKTFKSAYLYIARQLPSSPRPYLLATGGIYSTDNGQIVKGNFTVPR